MTCFNFTKLGHYIFQQAFSVVFDKAIDRAEPAEELNKRVVNLIDCITFSVYIYTTRGLFEKDKLIFGTQMTFLVSVKNTFLCLNLKYSNMLSKCSIHI